MLLLKCKLQMKRSKNELILFDILFTSLVAILFVIGVTDNLRSIIIDENMVQYLVMSSIVFQILILISVLILLKKKL